MTDTITQKLADALRECLGHIPDDETRRGLKALSALSEFDAEAHCDRSCTWLDHAPDCKIGGSAQAGPISDDEIERRLQAAGGRWNGDYWIIEDADLHPFVRAMMASPATGKPALQVAAQPAEAGPVYDSSVVRRLATQMGWAPPGAVAAERERCARLVEEQDANGDYVGGWFEILAAKIRAQPEHPAQGDKA
jgi:hypothetical protein